MNDEFTARYQNATPEEMNEEVERQHALYESSQADVAYYRDALAYIFKSARDWRWNRPSTEEDKAALLETMKEIQEKAQATLTHKDRVF